MDSKEGDGPEGSAAARPDLTELQRQLQAANAELEALAYFVAHDLKNPLCAIIGYSTMLQERHAKLPAEQVGICLASIENSANKIDRIIEELMFLTRVRSTQEVELEPLDMAEIVAKARARLADSIHESQAEVLMPADWPAAMGHSAWVEEIWVEYLHNAIVHGGHPPRIELGADPPGDGPWVRFWACDNGPDLPASEQARLFTPFERLYQERVAGRGLGLALVRRIVEKLGGEVSVESGPVQGTLLGFTLPRRQDP